MGFFSRKKKPEEAPVATTINPNDPNGQPQQTDQPLDPNLQQQQQQQQQQIDPNNQYPYQHDPNNPDIPPDDPNNPYINYYFNKDPNKPNPQFNSQDPNFSNQNQNQNFDPNDPDNRPAYSKKKKNYDLNLNEDRQPLLDGRNIFSFL